jgi:ribosomal protein S18 acetylase RimI-like enzyme
MKQGQTITIATSDDLPYLIANDNHISPNALQRKVQDAEILVIKVNRDYAGWLRWSYFWDMIPFMNMLAIEEALQGQGYGRILVSYWETLMQEQGHTQVMTSTQSDEQAQHFYRKLGYTDRGALLLPDEPTELIFHKRFG